MFKRFLRDGVTFIAFTCVEGEGDGDGGTKFKEKGVVLIQVYVFPGRRRSELGVVRQAWGKNGGGVIHLR